MPTPVRVRGKRGNKRLITSSKAIKTETTSSNQHSMTRSLSGLESLPTELIQSILWSSLNLNLTTVSPTLARKLNNNSLRRRFIFLAFFVYCIDHSLGYMRFYHEDSGTDNNYEQRHPLVSHILDQSWFSPKLFFSCQREYMSKILPLPLYNLLETQFKVSTKPWTMLQQNSSKQLPRWAIELLDSREPDQETSLTTENLCILSPEDIGIQWHSYGNGRFYISHAIDVLDGPNVTRQFFWKIAGLDAASQSIRTVKRRDISWYIVTVSLSPFGAASKSLFRFFNPEIWTEDNLAFLYVLMYDDAYFDLIEDPAFLEAVYSGIMTAISQKFLPAVFTQCSIREHRSEKKLTKKGVKALVSHIIDHADDQAAQGDISKDTNWILQWVSELVEEKGEWLLTGWRFNIQGVPATPTHLIKAMQMVCDPDFSVTSYYIFCWISISFVVGITTHSLAYPEDTVKQIEHLALTAGTEYACKCSEFFNIALGKIPTDYWTTSRL